MPEVDIGALRAVASHLDAAGLNYAFTGGSVVNLLLDNPDMSTARPTKDVNVIVELLTGKRYFSLKTTDALVRSEYRVVSRGVGNCRRS